MILICFLRNPFLPQGYKYILLIFSPKSVIDLLFKFKFLILLEFVFMYSMR